MPRSLNFLIKPVILALLVFVGSPSVRAASDAEIDAGANQAMQNASAWNRKNLAISLFPPQVAMSSRDRWPEGSV